MTTAADIAQYRAIQQEIHDRADAIASRDPAQLDLFITALTRAIALTPKVTVQGGRDGTELQFDLQTLSGLLDRAEKVKASVNAVSGGGFAQTQLERYC